MATLDVAEQFLFHVEPTTVLISVRGPDEFQQYVEKATIPAGMPLAKHQLVPGRFGYINFVGY